TPATSQPNSLTERERTTVSIYERRTVMFRRFLIQSVGASALVVMLGAPGQLHAQRVRGGLPSAPPPVNRMMINRVAPRNSAVFNRGFFTPGLNRNAFTPFTPRFNPR